MKARMRGNPTYPRPITPTIAVLASIASFSLPCAVAEVGKTSLNVAGVVDMKDPYGKSVGCSCAVQNTTRRCDKGSQSILHEPQPKSRFPGPHLGDFGGTKQASTFYSRSHLLQLSRFRTREKSGFKGSNTTE